MPAGAQPAAGATPPIAAGDAGRDAAVAQERPRASRSSRAGRSSSLADQRPLTLVLTTMPVIAHMTDAEGRGWLKVRLPGRELHRKTPPPTGWITADGTKVSTTPWHVVVSLATRSVHVYRNGRRVEDLQGRRRQAGDADAPRRVLHRGGMRLPRKHVGYPYALATSARSRVFKEFMGGPGQIAFHGIVNIPGSKMGTAELERLHPDDDAGAHVDGEAHQGRHAAHRPLAPGPERHPLARPNIRPVVSGSTATCR